MDKHMYSQGFEQERMTIIARLEKAFDLDQQTRSVYNTCVTGSVSASGEECNEKRKAMMRQDSINQEIVGGILDKYGWLPVDRITEKANKAFFYVIQHGGMEYQLKYAEEVEKAFKRKAITPLEYAFFVDRLHARQGKAQIYGTQAETDNLGNSYMYPLKDRERVNEWREGLGIPRLDPVQEPEYDLYPKTMEGDSVVVFGHIFREGNIPVAGAVVWKGSSIIGRSNEKGFFILTLPKKAGEEVHLAVSPDTGSAKRVEQVLKGTKDFYNIYIQFK